VIQRRRRNVFSIIAIGDRGFSKQNVIKNNLQDLLKLENLDFDVVIVLPTP
jgi:hypothetical protein